MMVVIVGRMNVGKSTLFNRMSQDVKSMVLDYPGVTRDVLRDTITWKDHTFDIVDTGGISLHACVDPILEKVRGLALEMVKQADVVIFVVDGTIGILPEDREVSRMLHIQHKKVIVAVNKTDVHISQQHIHEFYKLGQDTVVSISAEHNRNIDELLDKVVDFLPTMGSVVKEDIDYRVTLLGKPNVGKSSLMNELLQQERSLVSPQAGTTREAFSEKIAFYKENLLVTDTPGIRRKKSIEGKLEPMMVKSAFHALKDADIILLLMDAHEGELSDQELKLAFYAFSEQYKAVILLLNKTDLLNEQLEKELASDFEFYEHIIKKIPVLRISCKTGKNTGKVLPLIKEIWQRYSQRFSDADINRLFISALQKKPLKHKSNLLQVHEVKQLGTAPITIGLRVNEPSWFGPSQQAFFENLLRKEYNLVGVPLRFIVRREKFDV